MLLYFLFLLSLVNAEHQPLLCYKNTTESYDVFTKECYMRNQELKLIQLDILVKEDWFVNGVGYVCRKKHLRIETYVSEGQDRLTSYEKPIRMSEAECRHTVKHKNCTYFLDDSTKIYQMECNAEESCLHNLRNDGMSYEEGTTNSYVNFECAVERALIKGDEYVLEGSCKTDQMSCTVNYERYVWDSAIIYPTKYALYKRNVTFSIDGTTLISVLNRIQFTSLGPSSFENGEKHLLTDSIFILTNQARTHRNCCSLELFPVVKSEIKYVSLSYLVI